MNAPVTTANLVTVTAGRRIRRIRRRHDRAVTRSVAGIASWAASLVKIANSGPRRGSSSARVFSIRFSARRWLGGRLITLSCLT
jgi:hypothetical protein